MKKRLFAILLAVCMCFGMTTTAFAAQSDLTATIDNPDIMPIVDSGIMPIDGTETWSSTTRHDFNPFVLWGHNRTPVKTIGVTGHLVTFIEFDTQSDYIERKVLMQIEDADTLEVLAQKMTPLCFQLWGTGPDLDVKKGQRIRIDFWLYDMDGNYDSEGKLTITYGYQIETK